MVKEDSVLDFVGCDQSLLCALANGYIAVLATAGVTPPELNPLLYCIGNTAVQAGPLRGGGCRGKCPGAPHFRAL